jgi:hypothetical protein
MLKYYTLNAEGEPELAPDLLTWAAWFEGAGRIVQQTRAGRASVSTVFLGLDHNWSDDGQPVLWETMIFQPYRNQPYTHFFARRRPGGVGAWTWARVRRGIFDGDMWRYTTRADAVAGHDAAVRLVEAYRHGSRRYRKQILRRRQR